jgi:hypothetical protein
MLRRLRAKPGAEAIDAVEGDMTTQEAEVACFENAARHLAPGGCFVVEVYLPILRLLPPGERFHVFSEEPGYHAFHEYDDAASQLHWSHHLRLRERWADWDRTPFTADSEQHVSVWERPEEPGE